MAEWQNSRIQKLSSIYDRAQTQRSHQHHQEGWSKVNTWTKSSTILSIKNCPLLTRRLWRHLRIVCRKGLIAENCFNAEGCFISEEKNSSFLAQFNAISLFNVEGKIFLAIVTHRLTSFLMSNKYIDSSVQKGGIPGTLRCIENTRAVLHIIQEVKRCCGWISLMHMA